MNPDYATSESSTVTTPTSVPWPRKPSDLTEAQYLARQAANAKAAISKAASDVGASLAKGIDPRAWTREYPWLTLGATAVGSFVATAVLVPSKEQRALNKLAAIERALNPPKPKPVEDEDDGAASREYKRGQRSFLSSIAGELISAIKPAVISLLTAGITASQAKTQPEEIKAVAASEAQEQQQRVYPGEQ